MMISVKGQEKNNFKLYGRSWDLRSQEKWKKGWTFRSFSILKSYCNIGSTDSHHSCDIFWCISYTIRTIFEIFIFRKISTRTFHIWNRYDINNSVPNYSLQIWPKFSIDRNLMSNSLLTWISNKYLRHYTIFVSKPFYFHHSWRSNTRIQGCESVWHYLVQLYVP